MHTDRWKSLTVMPRLSAAGDEQRYATQLIC
jgi:hypothetical protein